MIRQLTKGTWRVWEKWVRKRMPKSNPQILNSQSIYILPSGFGWIYWIVVLSLFSGAINYQISTIFLMTFLLAVVALVSAWEAHANLKNLSIKLISIEDTYQGTPVQMILFIQANRRNHFGLEFKMGDQLLSRLEYIPPEGLQFVLPIVTNKRGCFNVPRITISSLYPFGIFRIWGYAYFDTQYHVYPQPINPGFWPERSPNQENKTIPSPGDNEFYDLRQVENPWLQLNLIAWKIAAKGQGWFLKTLDSAEGSHWVFSLRDLPPVDLESKLQYLCYWLVTAESNDQLYSLQLDHSIEPLARGKDHLQDCLRLLARYQ